MGFGRRAVVRGVVRVGALVGTVGMVVRLFCVICVPVCARVSRVCPVCVPAVPASPGVFLPAPIHFFLFTVLCRRVDETPMCV